MRALILINFSYACEFVVSGAESEIETHFEKLFGQVVELVVVQVEFVDLGVVVLLHIQERERARVELEVRNPG